MEKGDLIFEKGKGPIDLLVRLRTWSKYSHVAMYLGNGKIIESHWFGGVRIRDFDDAITYDYDVYEFPYTNAKIKAEIADNTCIYEGYKYDKLQILGFAFKGWLLGKNILNSPQMIICSELMVKGA